MPNETHGFVTKNSAKSRKLSRAVVSCVVNTRKKCHFPRWGCSVFTSHKSAYSSKVSIYVALCLTALCTPCTDQTAAPQPVISLVNHSDQNWNALFFLFLSFNEVFWSKNKIPSKRTEAAVVLNHTLNQFKTAELLDRESSSLHRQNNLVQEATQFGWCSSTTEKFFGWQSSKLRFGMAVLVLSRCPHCLQQAGQQLVSGLRQCL